MTLLRCSTHLYNLRPMGCDECERLANFLRSSQNQTASSGVEGADEGNTADKSGSRDPEKLNNAQPVCFLCDSCGTPADNPTKYCSACGQVGKFVKVKRLAESSLSSAIEFAEQFPLPRCKHGAALRDASGESLEPPCGCRATFRQSSSPTEPGAESVHSGKQNTADKSELLPTQLPKEK
jgi:hypothetical protein